MLVVVLRLMLFAATNDPVLIWRLKFSATKVFPWMVSEKVRLMVLPSTAIPETVGDVVSMGVPSITRAALAPREPMAPGAGRVRVASLPAASLLVPPLRARALLLVTSRSAELSPA